MRRRAAKAPAHTDCSESCDSIHLNPQPRQWATAGSPTAAPDQAAAFSSNKSRAEVNTEAQPQILALVHRDKKIRGRPVGAPFAARCTAQNPRPNRTKSSQPVDLETLPPSRIL